MKTSELIGALKDGALSRYETIYADPAAQAGRMCRTVEAFERTFGAGREVGLFSVPGRTEIIGNHTDHNHGRVIAAAIDRDVIAVASPSDEPRVRFFSEGYPMADIPLARVDDPAAFEKYSSASLIAGMCAAFASHGHKVGGFDAYSVTEVLKGSGISSSAAYEVMIGNILNHLYNDGKIPPEEIAKYAQYAENVYFGKPCGLMDQTACAVGGFVFIDFADPSDPVIEPISFSLSDAGYELCIVNTGGNHADLNEDYASVPAEMRRVAELCGRDCLRGLSEDELASRIPALRGQVGDRAILRALHFVREDNRVAAARDDLKSGNVPDFLSRINLSGRSSFMYLQNVYTVKNVAEQGLSLALAVTDGALAGRGCAFRVHGGGFAGTIQVFLRRDLVADYCKKIDAIFGEGAAMRLRVRPLGAVKLF